MNNQFVKFGKYILDFQFDSGLQHYIYSYFSSYFTDVATDCMATLQIKLVSNLTTNHKGTGWWHTICNDHYVVEYVEENSSVFSLAYDNSLKTIIVKGRADSIRSLSLGIQHAMLLALSPYCVGLHGVTLICKDRLLILSAPSGTGKTTLASLLQTHCEAAVINGDFALLSVDRDNVVFEPTPFCGTSKRCLNYRLPVDQIAFLSQSLENTYRVMDTREALIGLLSNVFVPTWDNLLSDRIQKTAFDIAESLTLSKFSFAPNQEAAVMFHSIVTK